MGFAVNILALLIVLGLCWAAMLWLGGRFHGHGGHSELDGWADLSRPVPTGGEPCATCDGSGAKQARGRLAPCPECYGTGVLS